MTKFRDVTVDEYFQVLNGKRLTKSQIIPGNIPYISSSLYNNGIQEYISNDNGALYSNCLSIAYNGKEDAVFYHPYEAIFSDNVRIIKYRDKNAGKYQYLYAAAIFRKVRNRFNYGNPMSSEKLRLEKIELPVNEKDEIDYEFMTKYIQSIEEKYIQSIEEKYIQTIELYLGELGFNGIDDASLTDVDIKNIEYLSKMNCQLFKLEDLFPYIKRGMRIKSLDRIKGIYPFVTAGVEKTGISDYIGNKAEIFKANSLTIDMFGSVFYRGYDFCADDHVTVLHSDNPLMTKRVLQFIQPLIQKAIKGKFSFSKNFYASDAPSVEIKLPITHNGEIDYKFIEDYIVAIEKKVVRNLKQEMDTRLSLFAKSK